MTKSFRFLLPLPTQPDNRDRHILVKLLFSFQFLLGKFFLLYDLVLWGKIPYNDVILNFM
jgi:hypothetical protein